MCRCWAGEGPPPVETRSSDTFHSLCPCRAPKGRERMRFGMHRRWGQVHECERQSGLQISVCNVSGQRMTSECGGPEFHIFRAQLFCTARAAFAATAPGWPLRTASATFRRPLVAALAIPEQVFHHMEHMFDLALGIRTPVPLIRVTNWPAWPEPHASLARTAPG